MRVWALDAAYLLLEEVAESFNNSNQGCEFLSVVAVRLPSEVLSSRRWGRLGALDASFAPWTSVNAPFKMSDLSRRKVNFIVRTAMAVT